mmetsp:Transcript_21588/g.83990  ORF Transcript_21588/g.83990 Transcript_21588/m.83990 type:complete len:280 (-) Transcript_21588:674-1513(-)
MCWCCTGAGRIWSRRCAASTLFRLSTVSMRESDRETSPRRRMRKLLVAASLAIRRGVGIAQTVGGNVASEFSHVAQSCWKWAASTLSESAVTCFVHMSGEQLLSDRLSMTATTVCMCCLLLVLVRQARRSSLRPCSEAKGSTSAAAAWSCGKKGSTRWNGDVVRAGHIRASSRSADWYACGPLWPHSTVATRETLSRWPCHRTTLSIISACGRVLRVQTSNTRMSNSGCSCRSVRCCDEEQHTTSISGTTWSMRMNCMEPLSFSGSKCAARAMRSLAEL